MGLILCVLCVLAGLVSGLLGVTSLNLYFTEDALAIPDMYFYFGGVLCLMVPVLWSMAYVVSKADDIVARLRKR